MEFDRKEILAAFLAETEEGLQTVEQSVVAVEANPQDAGSLDEIFRVAHTIKGNAALLELKEFAGFAHVVEDLLDSLRAKKLSASSNVVSLILESVDAFRDLLLRASEGNDRLTSGQEALKTRISSLVAEGKTDNRSSLKEEGLSPNAVAQSTGSGERYRTLRVEVGKLDRMLNLSGELTILLGRLRRMIEQPLLSQQNLLEMQHEAERLHNELQEQIMDARMVSIQPLFQQLIRAVRDLSQSQKKLARLEVAGGDVEVDTRVLEHLKDPLLHMIRNAIDHGIESPEKRVAAGKPACGSLRLVARHIAGSIVIQLSDDGCGFNRARILEKALAAGLVRDDDKLSDSELLRLVFNSGFSTAEKVTELSGRGVGMDVAKRNIEALRGSIEVESTEGRGSVLTLRLPLTLAIIEGFSVISGEQTYVIPLASVSECLDLPQDYIDSETGGVIRLRGEPLPFVRLSDALGEQQSSQSRQSVIVLQFEGGRAGLAVDGLLGESRAIIKPLDRLFRNVAGVSGSTILGDGRVALILDVNALMREAIAGNAAKVN